MGRKWLGRRMGAGYRCFCGLALFGLEQYGGERRGRRGYAEVAEGIPKLLGKGLNQCLCGLHGINGLEGAWGLVVREGLGLAGWMVFHSAAIAPNSLGASFHAQPHGCWIFASRNGRADEVFARPVPL